MDKLLLNPQYVVGIVRAFALALVILGFRTLTVEEEAALVLVISLGLTFVSSKLTVPKVIAADAPAKSQQTEAGTSI